MSSVQGSLADALEWQGINLDDFNAKLGELATEEERAAFIQSTLTDLYGESADQYIKNNASIIEANKAQSDYTDTMAKMGETIEPIMTTLKIGVTDLLNEFLKLVGDVDMEAFNAKIQEGFGVLKDEVLPAIKEGLGWILDNKDTLIAGLAGIASGFVAFKVAGLITSVVTAMKAWAVATQGMTIAQKALNLVMSLNPIGIVIALIAGLVAAFVTLWNKSDSFRQFWLDLWDKIKEGVRVAIEGIGKFFTETLPKFFNSLLTWVKTNWQSLLLILVNPFAGLFKYFYENNSKFREFVDNAVNQIKLLPEKIWTWLVNTITKITTWKNNMVAKAKEAGLNFVSKLIEAVSGLPDKMAEVGSNIVSGMWNGISSGWDWLKDKVSGLASSLYESAKEALGIHSPSRVFADEVGKWIPAGIAVGIDKNAKTALNSVKNLAMNTVGSARAGLNTATTLGGGSVGGGVVNNFTQVINSPKQLSRLDIYRQSKNLLGYAGGGF
jgi:phage-related protein